MLHASSPLGTARQRQTPGAGSGGGKTGRKKASLSASDDVDLSFRPPACLTAATRGEIFVVLSPLVPTKCMGLLLATCQRRGYQTRGIRRCRLNAKKAASLGEN